MFVVGNSVILITTMLAIQIQTVCGPTNRSGAGPSLTDTVIDTIIESVSKEKLADAQVCTKAQMPFFCNRAKFEGEIFMVNKNGAKVLEMGKAAIRAGLFDFCGRLPHDGKMTTFDAVLEIRGHSCCAGKLKTWEHRIEKVDFRTASTTPHQVSIGAPDLSGSQNCL